LVRPLNFNSHSAHTNGVAARALHERACGYPANFFLDGDTHRRDADCARLESELQRAVERDEFEVYYQPVVALATGRLKGFEALVRWRHAERGILPPSEFIQLAERTRIINDIGGWVLFEACRQMSEWRELMPASRLALSVGVNISARQLARVGLVELIERTLEQTNLPPRCLKLEINETALVRGDRSAFAALKRLRSLGVRLAVDDFGAGLSSLRQLRRLPFDTLKIDRSLVSRTGRCGEGAQSANADAAIALASSLGLTVVAKRVETDEQREHLGALGCLYAQGFLYSKPVDAETTLALVRRDLRSYDAHGPTPRDDDRSLSRLTQILAA
jgi:EAL domain-containing protein (putative c-di-GMP-specific phosphodiesterase class I)